MMPWLSTRFSPGCDASSVPAWGAGIKIVKVGRRTLVPETSLQDFQKKLLSQGLAN